MVLPSLATNLAQCLGPHWRALARRLWPLWLRLVLATLCSPLPDLAAAGPAARMALSGVLVAYGLWGLARPALPELRGHAAWLGGMAGVLSGVLTAATGVFAMPLVPYLQSLRLERDGPMQALGLSFGIATVALAVRLGSPGMADGSVTDVGHAVALVAAFAGLWVGTGLRGACRRCCSSGRFMVCSWGWGR
ncbi:MAG TPA: sulfite exporter TauE/SafE family protein [Burkholderiaceae bacterium]|nr:sulfite exporter TauE/SafE family protein [Burkholderiaceae bacterium]